MSSISSADVSGIVFKDLPVNGQNSNTYGVKDSNEFGIAEINVTAYPDGISTITASDGSWSLATTVDSRIEFSNTSSYLKESAEGGVKNSSVQFVFNGGTANFALHNPADFIGNSPDIAMSFHNNGLQRESPKKGDNVSVWGVAYNRIDKKLYVASSVKRYIMTGSGGIGAIYEVDPSASTTTLFTTISNVGRVASNSDRDFDANETKAMDDPLFNEVGRVGLGDLDISDDGKKLYTININTNEFVEIDIGTKEKKSFTIGNPFDTSCPSSDVKSWGIGQNRGKVYVGSVCTSSLTQGAYISEFNGTAFTSFYQIPLEMKDEGSGDVANGGHRLKDDARWRTWATSEEEIFDNALTSPSAKSYIRFSFPVPIVSDIVFDENNGMIIWIMDRATMQLGDDNYSPDSKYTQLFKSDSSEDILRVCKVDEVYYNEGISADIGDVEYLNVPAPIEIGDRVWLDTNFDGIQDANEKGISEVKVELVCSEDVKDSALTNSDGNYIFSNDPNGITTASHRYNVKALIAEASDCLLRVPNVSGTDKQTSLEENVLTLSDIGEGENNSSNDSDGVTNGDNADIAILSTDISLNGSNNHSLDFGFTKFVVGIYRLDDYVWKDTDESEVNDNNNSDANDSITQKDIADENNSDANSDGKIKNIKLNVDDLDEDMGIIAPSKASIGNFVWLDKNANGIQDTGELGVENINVTLFKSCEMAEESEVATQRTDENGMYLFEDLNVGSYCLLFRELPTTANITPPDNNTTTDEQDSDIAPSTGKTIPIKLLEGEQNHSWDMGIYYMATLGDRVWLDINKDGIQDEDERGVEDIKITLYTEDCLIDLDETKTDENGRYLFENLMPNSYCLGFSNILKNHIVTLQDVNTSESNDSDINVNTKKTINMLLVSGQDDRDWDVGIHPKPIYIFGSYFEKSNGIRAKGESTVAPVFARDEPYTPIYDELLTPTTIVTPIPSLVPTLTPTSTATPVASLIATVTPLPTVTTNPTLTPNPTAFPIGDGKLLLGDRVWIDSNTNGFQDSDEDGVADVTIILYGTNDCTGDVLGITKTDKNGKYLFGELDAGEYCLAFTNTPASYLFTQSIRGDDSNNSDANSSGKIGNINLISSDLTQDVGIYREEICEVSKVQDHTVDANIKSITTVIDIFTNNIIALDTQTITLIPVEDAKIFYNDGKPISTTNLTKFQTLRVEEEGVWEVKDGAIYFTVLDGFKGIPSPVYYVIEQNKGCINILGIENDLNQIGEVKIITPYICDTNETVVTDTVPINNGIMVVVLLLISLLSILFFRREELIK